MEHATHIFGLGGHAAVFNLVTQVTAQNEMVT
jgi:hypothetical protein